MKYILRPSVLIAFLMMGTIALAQPVHRCTGDYSHLTDNDPARKERMKQELQQIREQVMRMNLRKTGADSVLIVPMVVHVLHDNGKGAISKAQIESGLAVLNKDLRKLNADTTNIRSVFKPFIAPLNFEFRLAKIDPDGNCTDGIIYHNTVFTYNVLDTCKSVGWWPQDKYFNFWTVCNIDPSPWNLSGTIIGYEQFPWKYGINKTYGAVVRHDYWGNIGTASPTNDSRTLTHEIGHCFGLWHMWQDQSVGGVGNGCAFIVGNDCTDNDDMVCDTPPMEKPFYGCTTNLNSCSNDTVGPSPYPTDTLDQSENFMSYHDCQYMFTQGQKTRVDAVFATYAELQNLVSPANLLATGTNNGYVAPACAPKALLLADRTQVCKGTNVIFTDKSYNAIPSSWQWYFPGGTPSSSAAQNPTVKYDSTGTYDVTLVVTNSTGKDSVTYPKMIRVSSTTAKYNTAGSMFIESFEDSLVLDNEWTVLPGNGKSAWKRTNSAAYTGNSCIMVNNFSEPWNGELIEIISPSYNMSVLKTPEFNFKVAYARYDSTTSDVFKVLVSTDCGRTWTPRFSRTSLALASVPEQNTPFVPSSKADWKEDKFTVTGPYATATNLRFKIQLTAGKKRNNIYIDDINVRDISIGMDENQPIESFRIHPNPVKDQPATVEFSLIRQIKDASITVYDIFGREVKSILENGTLNAGNHQYSVRSDDLAPGIYIIRFSSQESRKTERLVVY